MQRKGALDFILNNPLLKQNLLGPVSQDHIQVFLSISTISQSKLCQSSVTLTTKQCFLTFRENLLHNILCLLSLPCHWELLKGTWLHPLHTLPFMYLQTFMSSLLTVPFSRLNNSRSLKLSWERST